MLKKYKVPRLSNTEITTIETNFQEIIIELNNIHHTLFSGEPLNIEELDASSAKLSLYREFIKNTENCLKSSENVSSLKHKLSLIPYFMFLSFFLIPFSIFYPLFITYLLYLNNCFTKRLEYHEKVTKLKSDLSQLKRRIINYLEVTTAKELKLEEVAEQDYLDNLVIANNYLQAYLEQQIDLANIPLNVQEYLTKMLQFELRINDKSLKDMLNIMSEKYQSDVYKRNLS